MSDYEPRPTDPELAEPSPTDKFRAIDALHHVQFQIAFTPETNHDVMTLVTELSKTEKPGTIGRLLIQYFMTSERERLADPNVINWVAADYRLTSDPEGVKVECTGIFFPRTKTDLVDDSELWAIPVKVITNKDIDWPTLRANPSAHWQHTHASQEEA
jgi:hypothetical protein